jgi:hypothetical protein
MRSNIAHRGRDGISRDFTGFLAWLLKWLGTGFGIKKVFEQRRAFLSFKELLFAADKRKPRLPGLIFGRCSRYSLRQRTSILRHAGGLFIVKGFREKSTGAATAPRNKTEESFTSSIRYIRRDEK